ncbi:MAG: hypothetical protein LC105_00085 [Chitinophagales bacterium]|nr:hypothetical protein [Chitinophagales bacterium]MCZ2392244.1 hypothetical protein [Chitinophagales bacterium]
MGQNELKFWHKLDNAFFGFLIGFLIPLLMFFIIYFNQYSHYDFSHFLKISTMKHTAPSILKTMVFPNMIVFLIGNMTKFFLFCKGIFYASFLIIVAMLLIKYL